MDSCSLVMKFDSISFNIANPPVCTTNTFMGGIHGIDYDHMFTGSGVPMEPYANPQLNPSADPNLPVQTLLIPDNGDDCTVLQSCANFLEVTYGGDRFDTYYDLYNLWWWCQAWPNILSDSNWFNVQDTNAGRTYGCTVRLINQNVPRVATITTSIGFYIQSTNKVYSYQRSFLGHGVREEPYDPKTPGLGTNGALTSTIIADDGGDDLDMLTSCANFQAQSYPKNGSFDMHYDLAYKWWWCIAYPNV